MTEARPLPANKDIEDALHIARVAGHVLDWDRIQRTASEVPSIRLEEFRELAA